MVTAKLKKLRIAHAEYNKRWMATRGHKLTRYNCPLCHETVEIRQPRKSDVDDRGFWDSLRTCVHCGEPTFMRVYPNGTVELDAPKELRHVDQKGGAR